MIGSPLHHVTLCAQASPRSILCVPQLLHTRSQINASKEQDSLHQHIDEIPQCQKEIPLDKADSCCQQESPITRLGSHAEPSRLQERHAIRGQHCMLLAEPHQLSFVPAAVCVGLIRGPSQVDIRSMDASCNEQRLQASC